MKMIDFLYNFFLIISLTLMYFSYRQYNVTKELLVNGFVTQATVIDLIESRSDDSYTYAPVFEYMDMGNKVVFKSEISSSPAPYGIGDTVDIVYASDNESHKVISFWGLYRWTVILLAIAMPFFVIGGAYILYSSKF